ncbi:MAG TPA: hypothetical protein V6D14_30825 [Coleofasciculaceae cyanobacterium]
MTGFEYLNKRRSPLPLASLSSTEATGEIDEYVRSHSGIFRAF